MKFSIPSQVPVRGGFTLPEILIAVAVEGVICLVMAAPIALPVAWIGGFVGYGLRHQQVVRNPAMFLLLAGLTPFGATAERALHLPAEIFPVTTSIDLPASPERVWHTVLQPARLSAPEHPLFRAGVAYPLASHIEGTGLTAVVGENGEGKTNLLEAIGYLATLASFRGAPNDALVPTGGVGQSPSGRLPNFAFLPGLPNTRTK